MLVDQTSDVSRQRFFKFTKFFEIPDYVKRSSVSDVFERNSEQRSTAFADVRGRQFPCQTKAATWVSYLYFLDAKTQPEFGKEAAFDPKIASWIEERLDRFAESWGIAPDIAKLKEKHAEIHREKLADNDFMLVWAGDNGTKERQYPLRNATEVKTASAWFCRNRYHFPYADRRTMATRLLEKISQFGAAVEDEQLEAIEKQAGRGTYDPESASTHIKNRAALAPDAVFGDRMRKMAEQIADNTKFATCTDTVRNLCATVDMFDRMIKLAGQYSQDVPSPEDIFCQIPFATVKAAVNDFCTLQTGVVYNRDDFSSIPLGEIRSAFGSDIANAVSNGFMTDPEKLAEVAATLPRPDAQLLDRILDANGVRPVMKQATAVQSPTFSELRELASLSAV